MRGKAVQLGDELEGGGITPAYAGKSRALRPPAAPAGDHPRVCGEKPPFHSSMASSPGSPPRMRGKACPQPRQTREPGITPAYAGKRIFPASHSARHGDHPRVCGEKLPRRELLPIPAGSPPRMRGKAYDLDIGLALFGITPAYAGKSSEPPCPSGRPRDHPRVCGEKQSLVVHLARVMGSPPRMRGKVIAPGPPPAPVGITPAYAGKRATLRLINLVLEDHPRVCGEKKDGEKLRMELEGSPPRMRGKVDDFEGMPLDFGITPAYAGKSGSSG